PPRTAVTRSGTTTRSAARTATTPSSTTRGHEKISGPCSDRREDRGSGLDHHPDLGGRRGAGRRALSGPGFQLLDERPGAPEGTSGMLPNLRLRDDLHGTCLR